MVNSIKSELLAYVLACLVRGIDSTTTAMKILQCLREIIVLWCFIGFEYFDVKESEGTGKVFALADFRGLRSYYADYI